MKIDNDVAPAAATDATRAAGQAWMRRQIDEREALEKLEALAAPISIRTALGAKDFA